MARHARLSIEDITRDDIPKVNLSLLNPPIPPIQFHEPIPQVPKCFICGLHIGDSIWTGRKYGDSESGIIPIQICDYCISQH